MPKRSAGKRDALIGEIEAALRPGRFIDWRASSDFVAGLDAIADRIQVLELQEPARAVTLYEAFLAGVYEKTDECDGSDGGLGMFVDRLYAAWIRSRQASGSDPDETARILLLRMEEDPWGYTCNLERQAVPVLDEAGLAAFERQVELYFEKQAAGESKGSRHRPGWAASRRGEILRTIYAKRRDVQAYVAICEATEVSAEDCHAIATMLEGRRKAQEALAWVERGMTIEGRGSSMARHDLTKLKRKLLVKLGRADDAIAEAWEQFCDYPSRRTYEEVMQLVPKGDRPAWHAKAMAEAAARAKLGELIDLYLEAKEIDRLAERLRTASDAELEAQSHYHTEPAAEKLAKSYPDVAARVFRALGVRIVAAGKSKYYCAALSHFADAWRCYRRAGMEQEWKAMVSEVRREHSRKYGFMAGFEELAKGRIPGEGPSFLDRARDRWALKE